MRGIRDRGREYEMIMLVEYLQRLRDYYELHMSELGETVRIIDISVDESRHDVAAKVLSTVRTFAI